MSQLQNDLMLAHAAFLTLPYILAAIQNGADPLYQHQSGESVALALANLGDDIGVYELAKLEPRVLFQRSAHGETPAIRLAFQNHHTAVVHLARLNPDILTQIGPNGTTCALLAAMRGYGEEVVQLATIKREVVLQKVYGKDVIEWLISKGKDDAATELENIKTRL